MGSELGTEWRIVKVEKIVDGDTLRIVRAREMKLGDETFTITDVVGKLIRLVWVDTPERGDHPGWEQARQDLTTWLTDGRGVGLRVVCYESAGWDRVLGDVLDWHGNSASQWLMAEKGWPPYVRGK